MGLRVLFVAVLLGLSFSQAHVSGQSVGSMPSARAHDSAQRHALLLQYRLAEAALSASSHVGDRLTSWIHNAQLLANDVRRPELRAYSRVARNQLRGLDVIRKAAMRLVPLPVVLRGQYDDLSEGGANLIFYPDHQGPGTTLFFANRAAPAGPYDLFFIEKLDLELWSRPEPVGGLLNSPWDEVMPLYDAATRRLYYSSSGEASMGGYDIMYADFDVESGAWSEPRNLGIPFNSAWDDFLLCPPDSSGILVLASGRGVSSDSLGVYTLAWDSAQPGVRVTGEEELLDITLFHARARGSSADQDVALGRIRAREEIASTRPTYSRADDDPAYVQALAEGYAAQKVVDSLRIIVDRLKETVWDAASSQARDQAEARLKPVLGQMLSEQRRADRAFIRASEVQRLYITGARGKPSNHTGDGAFSQDNPPHLYAAKLASTVFQQDEILRLKRIANVEAALDISRRALYERIAGISSLYADSTASIAVIRQAEAALELLAQTFARKYADGITSEREIYGQCLAVAQMKTGRFAAQLVAEAEGSAMDCFRLAQAQRSNLDSTTPHQGTFQALCLEKLGASYLVLAYAYTWNMRLFAQKTAGQIAELRGVMRLRPDLNLASGESPASPTEKPSPSPEPEPPPPAPRIALVPSELPGLEVVRPFPYDADHPVPLDAVMPRGVVYSLQLGAYTNPVDPVLFGGMRPIFAHTLEGGRIRKYFAGEFRTKDRADAARAIAVGVGFSDAFVVAWHDGRRISLTRARSMEGMGIVARPDPELANSTLYNVYVGRFSGPIPASVVNTLRNLAPGMELRAQVVTGGGTEYFVGPFATQRAAERLRDNLVASGQLEALVRPVGQEEAPPPSP